MRIHNLYVDDKGELKGMRVELANECCKRLGLAPDYIRTEFATMLPGLAAQRRDMINPGIFWTEERSKLLYMLPYEQAPPTFLAAWSVALPLLAVAAFTEVLGAAEGWNPELYRAYYYFGGITVVGVLALGTIFLLAPRYGRPALLVVVILAGIGLAGILGAGLQAGLLQTHEVPPVDTIRLEHGLFNAVALLTAALLNIVGSLVLIGGAAWSAYGPWRRRGAG